MKTVRDGVKYHSAICTHQIASSSFFFDFFGEISVFHVVRQSEDRGCPEADENTLSLLPFEIEQVQGVRY